MPKININGIVREMTAEEIAEMERIAAEMPVPTPDPNEARIKELEAMVRNLSAAVTEMGAK